MAMVRQVWYGTFAGRSEASFVPRRMLWSELCSMPEFTERWVAFEAVTYEDGRPSVGDVIDADEDLATLCARVQSQDGTNRTILYCDASGCGMRRRGLG